MQKLFLPCLIAMMCLVNHPAFAQTDTDTTLLGLPGDNLDLYAVMDIFQKSKTIEAFEKTLNDQKTGINNLDLDLDKKVDFIKVVTKKKDSSFTFVLQVAVSEKETQDVAVIFVDKDKNGKVTMQMVGDKELYGPNYIVEPKPPTPAVTANPGYSGPDPVTVNVTVPTTTVVVQTAPIVQYVYSPAYVPYYPPYYYGFYPPYFAAFTVMAVGIYRSNNYYYHGHGCGYHNTTVIHNTNNFNNYNGSRNTSNRVSHNNANGSYGNGNRNGNRQNGGVGSSGGNRPSTTPSNRPSTGGGASGANRPSTQPSASNRASTGASSSRPSTSNYSSGGGRTRSGSSGYSGGGGFSGGGGGMRGGGGGGRRR